MYVPVVITNWLFPNGVGNKSLPFYFLLFGFLIFIVIFIFYYVPLQQANVRVVFSQLTDTVTVLLRPTVFFM